jgi:hypothetical protein
MNGTIYALAVSGTNLYAGGSFGTAGGAPAVDIAKWDGSAWSALGSGIAGSFSVFAVAVSATNIYAGGYFPTASGVPVNNIAEWNGSTWSALGSGMSDQVMALAVSGTNLYAGGAFLMAGEVTANYIAKWDGSSWSALGSGMNYVVNALAVSGTNLYAGGAFTMAGGVSANYIAKWDGSTWSALGSGMSGGPRYVHALAVSGTNLYAGGTFTTAGGVPATNIAKWDGSAWSALGSGMGSLVPLPPPGVSALVVSGTNLYAGGRFTTAGGVAATNIAQWDGNAWSALGSGMNYVVNALAVSGTNLYAAGNFTTAGGVPANYIAQWDGSTWSALGSGMNGAVGVLAVSGTNLYAGGYFTNAGGVPANHIAQWDGSTWSALGSGTSDIVWALAADGLGYLFVGGGFYLAGTNVSPFIAQANLGSAPTILMPPQTQTAEDGSVVNLAARVTGFPPLTYQWYFNGNALAGCTNSVLCLSGVQATNVGTYWVVIGNSFGTVTSAPVMLNVISPVDRRPVPGINLMGDVGASLNVEYSDYLGSLANWLLLNTLSLTNPPQYCFDIATPLPPERFYRAWQTGTPSVVPSLNLNMVPAITLSGNIGDKLQLDYINQFGPTNAWVTLATVTLTNTSQLYFDVSAPGQPARLYQIVPVP